MADNVKKPARARMWKRIALYMGSISTIALVAFVIISFLPTGGDSFSIRIDRPASKAENNKFHMGKKYGETSGQEAVTLYDYLKGDSLDKMTQTTAADVEKHIAELKADAGLEAQQNYINEFNDKGYALVYTVYLYNESDEDIELYYTVNLDEYVNKSKDNDPLNFFRVLAQYQKVDDDNSMVNVYYGQKHNCDDKKNEIGNYREAISTKESSFNDEDPIKPLFKSVGNEGYCVNFRKINLTNVNTSSSLPPESNETSSTSDDIVVSTGESILVHSDDAREADGKQMILYKNSTIRFTFAAFFEGNDRPDSDINKPLDCYMKLSLHFGAEYKQ